MQFSTHFNDMSVLSLKSETNSSSVRFSEIIIFL